VDLKLKICRGTSIKKIIVREAQSYSAATVIVGTARNHHKLRPSTSLAKYCAKKLPKDCWVLAVNNGKVVFKREGSPTSASYSKGDTEEEHEVLNEGNASVSLKERFDRGTYQELEEGLAKAALDSRESAMKEKCSICESNSDLPDNCGEQSAEDSSNDGVEDKSLAIFNLCVEKELPESKPGWPLLRRSILPDKKVSERSLVRQISVVQWALRLPSRKYLYITNSDHKQNSCDQCEDQSSTLDSESGAIVPVDTKTLTAPPSPERNSSSPPKELEGLHEKHSSSCRLFRYPELRSATLNFSPGGSSQVYRGFLPDGRELAVKILKPSEDALRVCLGNEIITTLHHKNIISLVGFCFEDGNLLLVYEFLSRGSLEENLHGNKKDPLVFGWSERCKVAVGVAEALEYLHSGSAQPVIHRDVKSSNILLSDDFEPQLSDFGLAVWASTSSSHITCTDVAGTFGLYAFGVVLLELLSGRKPISSEYPKGQESLAKQILNGGKVSQLLDPSLGDNYDQDQMERMILAATLCIRRAPRARPQISILNSLMARLQVNASDESDMLDGEACPRSNLQSHLNLALLDVGDDSLSMSSIEQSVSLEDYLQGRWSRSSSFD
ncbi:hypothetical protein RGQ29_030922, partial [Quercus rubra]